MSQTNKLLILEEIASRGRGIHLRGMVDNKAVPNGYTISPLAVHEEGADTA